MLRQLAGYVQSHHCNNLARLLASGFEAASTNSAPVSLSAPGIRKIAHGHSGQLILRIT